MEIPDRTVYPSRLRTYGTDGFRMNGVTEEAGCPRLFKLKYIERAIQEPSAYVLEYGSLVHDALFLAEEEDLALLPAALDKAVERSDVPLGPDAYTEAVKDLTRYMDRRDDHLATVAVEQHLTMPLMEIDGVEYLMGGYIDRIAIDTDDPRTVYVVDYKTDRTPPGQAKIDANNQMTHYAAIVRGNLDKYLPGVDPEQARIVIVYDAIKWYPVYSERPHWQMDDYVDWCKAMTRRIVADQEAKPVLNPACSWCPAKYDCPAFQALPGEGETLADRMSKTSNLEQRVLMMQQAEMTIRALKGMVDEVVSEVKAEAPLEVNGVRYEMVDDFATDWDLATLYEVLGEKFFDVVSVTGYKVKDVLHRYPELQGQVDACMSRYQKDRRRLKKLPVED
jgi:hypothetical protein